MAKTTVAICFITLLALALSDLNGVTEALLGFDIRWRRDSCSDRSSDCVGNEELCIDEVRQPRL